jgi:hypothetical protein
MCPQGAMLDHPDPHFEGVFYTATGGDILIEQYPASRLLVGDGGQALHLAGVHVQRRCLN